MTTLTKFSLSWWSESSSEPSTEDYLCLNAALIFELNLCMHTCTHTLQWATCFSLSHTHTHTWHQISFTNFKHRPSYACTVCGKGLFSAQPWVLWQVLRGGRRVNIGGWMRQSAAFTYRWGEESDLASFHGSLHLQKLDWKQYSERCGISRCVWVCVSVFKSKS